MCKNNGFDGVKSVNRNYKQMRFSKKKKSLGEDDIFPVFWKYWISELFVIKEKKSMKEETN